MTLKLTYYGDNDSHHLGRTDVRDLWAEWLKMDEEDVRYADLRERLKQIIFYGGGSNGDIE